jgi:hypothetical protein
VISYLLIRFVLGGLIVSGFAVVSEMFKPKTFAGLFGAAPSVGLATLALTFHKDGSATVSTEAWWMLSAIGALIAYSTLCVVVCRRRSIPVWLGAAVSWVGWFVVAGIVWFALYDRLDV